MNRLKSKTIKCNDGHDLIEYKEGINLVLAKEFNVFNLSDKDVSIEFNDEDDVDYLILEPGEGFDTCIPISHAVIRTDDSTVKYSYWI